MPESVAGHDTDQVAKEDAPTKIASVDVAQQQPAVLSSPNTTPLKVVAGDPIQERANQLYRGYLLAPMVRASTTPLRTLALRYGANAVFSEELVDRSISSTIRQEDKEKGWVDFVKDLSNASAKTKRRMARENHEGPPLLLRIDQNVERGKLILQIGSGEPELALAAAQKVQHDVDAIDINMGCPKKFSVSGGMGSALLDDADRACRILKTLREGIPHLPISCKIRLLSEPKETTTTSTNKEGKRPHKKSKQSPAAPPPATPPSIPRTMEFIDALVQKGGIHALAIHGRTVGHDATIPAAWDALKQVVQHTKKAYPHLPVLVNGDFYTQQEMVDFMKESHADGVLLARPALYNPSIFRRPQDDVPPTMDLGYQSPLLEDRTRVIQEYLREALKYNMHYKNVKYVLCEIMNNRRAPSHRVHLMPQIFPGEQTIGKICACQSLEEMFQVWDIAKESDTEEGTAHSTANSNGAAPAGDHKYEDEYLLNRMGSDAIPNKRPRVEVTK